MRWDIRSEDLSRIGRGARVYLDGMEQRRVRAFDTEEGWVVLLSDGGDQCACRLPAGSGVHLLPGPEFQEFDAEGNPLSSERGPCEVTRHGTVTFIPGQPIKPEQER